MRIVSSGMASRCLHVALLAALVVLCCTASGASCTRDEASHREALQASELPFALPDASTFLQVLATPTPAALRAAQPLLLLFTDESAVNATATTAIRAKVRQLAADLPASVLRVHEFAVPATVRDRRLIDIVLNGVARRLPALILFHGDPRKAQVIPGSLLANAPLTPPLAYPAPERLSTLTYMELRTWVLSEVPARYVDPITYHLQPSLQFLFHPTETQQTIRLVHSSSNSFHKSSNGAETEEKADVSRAVITGERRSALPAAVAMAYVRLTTHGSEEVVAALSAIATQASNAVLTLVTESAEVAAEWGLTQEHTLATAPWSAVEAAYINANCTFGTEGKLHAGDRASTNAAATQGERGIVVVEGVSAPQPIGTIEEVAAATASSSLWQDALAQTAVVQTSQLRTWQRAMDAFNTTSPLRKLDSAAHLVRELVSLQQAMKVIFVLRESDELWFHHHLDVAVKLAGRMQSTSILYNTTTLQKNAKVPSRVVRAWTPPARTEIFWLDAEQLPEVADSLYVAQVPSVLILAPLQSRYQEVSAGEGEEEAASTEAGLRSRDPFIGIHTVNRYDLMTAAFTNDATAAADPPTGKDAAPIFPSDSDALLRFLASESFINAVQYALRPMRLSQLQATAASLMVGARIEEEDSPAQSETAGLPNRRYTQLDFHYYPLRLAEEPMEGPVYVRQILNGSSPLPVVTEAERRDAARGATGSNENGGAAATNSATAKAAKAAAAAAQKKKEAWEAELRRRQQQRAERMQRKAAEDAAAREKEKAAFQRSVETAFREEAEAGAKSLDGDGKGVHTGGSGASHGSRVAGAVLVPRPPREAAWEKRTSGSAAASTDINFEPEDAEDAEQRVRRRRRYAEYQAWRDDRAQMAERCVSFVPGTGLSLRFKWS